MKRTIFPHDFAPYYPLGIKPCPMYVDIANRVNKYLKGVGLQISDADEIKKEIAINVAIYYEDKMSGIGLWNAFVNIHNQAYHRQLPFYDAPDTLDKNDVNAKEVELLIWLVISRNFDDRFINPLALGDEVAYAITDILTEDDEVEENEALHDLIYDKKKTNDYFGLKNVMIWLRRSYLLCSPVSEDHFYEILEKTSNSYDINENAYTAETMFLMTTEIGPMALKPHEWLAEMFNDNDMRNEAEQLRSLEYCQQDYFSVTDSCEEYVILRDTRGVERKVKANFQYTLHKGMFISTALVKYGDNDWEINGAIRQPRQGTYDKICEEEREHDKITQDAYSLFMKHSGGKRLIFFKNKSELKKMLHDITPDTDDNLMFSDSESDPQLMFITKNAQVVIPSDIIHAIKCDANPYYRQCDDRELAKETSHIIIDEEAYPAELLKYLIENDMLQDGDVSSKMPSKKGNETFTRNLDFISRNHRRHFYHSNGF